MALLQMVTLGDGRLPEGETANWFLDGMFRSNGMQEGSN